MKKLVLILLVFISMLFLNSCRNKTVLLLSKKWDCVQVDHIAPPGTKFLSPKDSADAEQLRSILQSISWTFKDRMKYECSINGRVIVQGKYDLLENDKIMVCTPESKNRVNRYIIRSLTEDELVLNGSAENANLILHFKPN
ncbi:MAG: hypothetical protein ABIN74_01460 [Ferruginibacter sp.]